MEYNSYHACINDCILYKGEEYDTNIEFPKYKESRYNEKGKKTPNKVVHVMLILPIWMQIFQCKSLVELMEWNARNRSEEGVLCILADSKAIKHIEEKWPEKFKDKPWSFILGLTMDGVNQFLNKYPLIHVGLL